MPRCTVRDCHVVRAILHVAMVVGVVSCSRPGGESSPQAPKRPLDCVTSVDNEAVRQWRLDGSHAIAKTLPGMDHCFNGLEDRAYLQVTLYRREGETLRASITGATTNNCDVTQCALTALQSAALAHPPTGSAQDAVVQEIIRFDPQGTPRLRLSSTPDISLSPEGPCVARDRLPVSGQLPPVHIQGVIRAAAPTMLLCYERALAREPSLHGRIVTRFVIGLDGRVQRTMIDSNSLPDCEVVSCIESVFAGLTFDAPHGGQVTVVYPLILEPSNAPP
jgi:hypothetical protein